MAFIPATDPGVVARPELERLASGALRSPAGLAGCVLYGPYAEAEAGVYRITARTRALEGEGRPLYWDVYADGRVYAARDFADGGEVVVHLPDTRRLEFRFTTDGTAFEHQGVELEPVLLDREPVASDRLHALIRELLDGRAEPEALFALFERLAASGEIESAEGYRSAYLAGRERPLAQLRSILAELHTPGRTTLSDDLDADFSDEQIDAAAAQLTLRRVDIHPQTLHPLHDQTREDILALGYQPDFIQATRLHRSLSSPRRPWQLGRSGAAPLEPLPSMTQALVNSDLSFQDDLARGDGMTAYCPVSGRAVRSRHGFALHWYGLPQTFYRFEGVEVFYVCTGGFANSRLFLYMPRTGLIVALEEEALRWYPYAQFVRQLSIKLMRHRHAVRAYLNAPTRPAAVFGLNNIGHFFWNELSGLQHLVDAGHKDRLAEIVTTPIQYVDHRPLFPDLDDVPTTHVEHPTDCFLHFVAAGQLPIRFTDAVITPALFARVRRAADAQSTAAGRPPPDAPRPLIWLNLRENNKIWVDQAEGYAEILNALHAEHGSASALLQGMPDCAGLAEEIRRRVHPDIALYDGMNLSTYDKLSFAGHVEAYMCVAGAGLAFTTWLADVHGVAHAEHGHLDHLPWWRYVRPEAPIPHAPPKSAVKELGTGWYCNYEVDWRLLLELLRKALRREPAPVYDAFDAPPLAVVPPPEPEPAPEPDFIPASALKPSFGHAMTTTEGGTRVWDVAGHHDWFLYGPYASVRDGLYRIKVRARVDGPEDALSYVDVFDTQGRGGVYAAHRFRADPEMFVRLYESRTLEFRFRTFGETLTVEGVELEPVLLDDELASAEDLRRLAVRMEGALVDVPAMARVFDRLADLGFAPEAERLRAGFLARRTAARGSPAVRERLLRVHGLWPLPDPAPARPRPDPEVVRRTVESTTLRILDGVSSTPESRLAFRGLGYEADHVAATRMHRDYDEPPRLWHDRPAETGHAGRFPIRQPLFERYVDIDRSHQSSMARGLGFAAHCPVSGRLLRSHHGFLVHYAFKPFVFYRFEGAETFYVCTGSNSDVRLFLYMPRTETVIWIADPAYQVYEPEALVRPFNAMLVRNADAVAAYLTRPTRPAAVLGNDNYGHYFWLDLSGLQFAVDAGFVPDLAAMVKCSIQFADPEVLFPEFDGKPVLSSDDGEAAFRRCVDDGLLPIHFTDVSINDALIARLHATADRLASPAGQPTADAPRPLLWLNLRAHNKIWRDQVEGYANILNALYNDYGQVSALLDGVPDCAELAAGIRARTRPEITLYDGLDFSLYDKLSWGRAVDGHITVIGTGLIIIHSLAGAKGVAHGNREHLNQLTFWHTIHPGSGTPLAPEPDEIVDEGTELQRDYDVDWRVLLKLIRQVLDPQFARAQSTGAPVALSASTSGPNA